MLWRSPVLQSILTISLYHLLCVPLYVFISHCPSLFILHLPPLCLTLSCLRASICLQSSPPSPHTPYSSPSTQISFRSLSLHQLLPSSRPVWLEPWLVQLSIMKAKPCQGRLNPEALLYPHCLLFYLSQSHSFNKFVPVNKPSKMTPSP